MGPGLPTSFRQDTNTCLFNPSTLTTSGTDVGHLLLGGRAPVPAPRGADAAQGLPHGAGLPGRPWARSALLSAPASLVITCIEI